MPKLTVVTRSGEERVVEGNVGTSLMEVLLEAGIEEINAITSCGGCCSCGTCHIYVDAEYMDRLPAMRGPENNLLSIHSERGPLSRLSCQVPFSDELDGLRVTIAPEW